MEGLPVLSVDRECLKCEMLKERKHVEGKIFSGHVGIFFKVTLKSREVNVDGPKGCGFLRLPKNAYHPCPVTIAEATLNCRSRWPPYNGIGERSILFFASGSAVSWPDPALKKLSNTVLAACATITLVPSKDL